jgi:hypothetical protein
MLLGMTTRYVGAFAFCAVPKRGRDSRWICLKSSCFLVGLALACSCGDGRDLGADGGSSAARADAAKPTSPRSDLPPVTWGLDSYRAWQRMYRVRIGSRTYMRSTYDRAGGNEGVDASHFLRQEPGFFVPLDVAGPGIVSFVRTNHWHGSPWHYIADGRDQLVTESSTQNPLAPVEGSRFMPEAVFPNPLTYTWSTTRGADLNWVPIAFEQRFTLGYERTHYGTGYYIYQSVPHGTRDLSEPLRPFAAEPPDPQVLALLGRAGEDIAADGPTVERTGGSVDVAAGETVALASFEGSGVLVALALSLPREQALAANDARLRIYWDGADEPAVDAPLALFFAAGTFYNRSHAEWLVRALLLNVRFSGEELELASYFPMPFLSRARIELIGGDAPLRGVRFALRRAPYDDPPHWAAHFRASYRDHGEPVPGRDLVLLDTTQVEGGGQDFCGRFVGTSFTFSDRAVLSTLEGDPRFFFDDSASPQAYGTGTEEWGGGGDYWGGQTMTLPLAGHPVGAVDASLARAPEDLVQGAYRLLIADAMPFGKNARIQLEHGGLNDSTERYRTLVYWYGRRGACLVQSDAVQIGDLADERAHDYVSPSASAPVELRSRYELGVDHAGGVEVVPEMSERGRFMTGSTELTLALHPDNVGALLRRTLDYGFPDQRAEVFVAGDAARDDWRFAGVWYLAGSHRCVYSNPPGELDPPSPVLQTSNRRLRQDEFLIDRTLTEGRTRIRVRIVFAPERKPLVPGEPLPELAWSELRYQAYSWLLPR